MTDPLIPVSEAILAQSDPDTLFLDATWTFPGGPQPKSGGYIPGAIEFDFDRIKDDTSSLPHMLPKPADFARQVEALGISNRHNLIVYDRMGLFSAARVWWMFRAMGHDRIQVLSGGLPAWRAEGGRVEDFPARPLTPGQFIPSFRTNLLASAEDVLDAVQSGAKQILDARPAARFAGTTKEPRPGMRAGHMPGALNLPFGTLLDSEGKMSATTQTWTDAKLDLSKPVITTCGSGVTACILALGLFREGIDAAVYDGSWAEWGSRPDTPITAKAE